jgi:predicted dehydrogenase
MALNSGKLRWGILGTAQIARKIWRAIHDSGNCDLVAVASRDGESCNRFIQSCQAEVALESKPAAFSRYEDLLACDAVEAVYIPLPTGLRKEWVLRAAAAGKHILCEKPCAITLEDLREMVEACQRNQVQFMDNVMFMHSRRLERLRQVLDDGRSIGKMRRITSAFTFLAPPEFFAENIRADSLLEPHGCLGDLGWYCLRIALWGMNWQMPRQVTGRVLAEHAGKGTSTPVPTEFSGELLFADGVSAAFFCSFLAGDQQWFNISGTEGYVEAPDFVLPFVGQEVSFAIQKNTFNVKGCDFRMETERKQVVVPEHSHGHSTAQETNLFRNFSNQVRSGKLNANWPHAALKTQELMCACRESAQANGQPISLI